MPVTMMKKKVLYPPDKSLRLFGKTAGFNLKQLMPSFAVKTASRFANRYE